MKIILPYEVEKIINVFKKYGYEAFAVGGCVRDSYIKRNPNDWDISTNSLPEETIKIFDNENIKTIETGIKHGTVTIVLNNKNYEVTTYRIEGEYYDNRRPSSVEFTKDIIKDLSRRDFTINAMAYNYDEGLLDPFNGICDIKKKIIKTVGDPKKRFEEDSLRILRAVRFSAQLGYDIDKNTLLAMKSKEYLLSNISKERIREELNKILLSSKPSYGIRLLHDLSLLNYVIPELLKTVGFDQKNPHHDKDVFNHLLETMDNTEDDIILRLSGLLHDIGKPKTFTIDSDGIGHFYNHHNVSEEMAEEILKSLKYDNDTIKNVKILTKEHMNKYNDISDKGIKRLINKVGIENLPRLFKLQRADIRASSYRNDTKEIDILQSRCNEILNKKEPLNVKDLKINGKDLINLGLEPGPKIGEVLNNLLEKVLENPENNNKENLLKLAKELL